jgi:hypothetical protein
MTHVLLLLLSSPCWLSHATHNTDVMMYVESTKAFYSSECWLQHCAAC